MAQNDKKGNLFELVKSMTKAEKRNFKLYAMRLSGNGEAKFLALFDCLCSMDTYDERKVLLRCHSIKPQQLSNMKAHLYKQILVSMRLLNVRSSVPLELHEQIDFARILFDKGLYQQALRTLERAAEMAEEFEQNTAMLEIIELRKQIMDNTVSGEMTHIATAENRLSMQVADKVRTANELSNLAVRLYALHLQLGYARSQKDLDLLNLYFKPRLDSYASRKLSFTERFYFYQAMAWYHYVRHNFAYSYRYGRAWINMFDERPQMKEVMYDSYLRGYSKLLEGAYLMRKYGLFVEMVNEFERESRITGSINENAVMISQQILFTARINKYILEASFKEGLWMTRSIDSYLRRYARQLSAYEKMMLDYKIAMLYFADGNYLKCMEHLSSIIAVKDPQVRRDLQCYARMLNIIASYDAGIDYNLDYQIRSVFSFIVKMNDMTEMKREIFDFLRKIGRSGVSELQNELKVLYDRLKPYENHPYERRTFYYLDLMTWIETKLTGRTFAEISREKFERLLRQESNTPAGKKPVRKK